MKDEQLVVLENLLWTHRTLSKENGLLGDIYRAAESLFKEVEELQLQVDNANDSVNAAENDTADALHRVQELEWEVDELNDRIEDLQNQKGEN